MAGLAAGAGAVVLPAPASADEIAWHLDAVADAAAAELPTELFDRHSGALAEILNDYLDGRFYAAIYPSNEYEHPITLRSIHAERLSLEGSTDELALLIESYREAQKYRNLLTARLIAAEAFEPSLVVERREIEPSVGMGIRDVLYTPSHADDDFGRILTSDYVFGLPRERYVKAWEYTKTLFATRRTEHDQWKVVHDIDRLTLDEEEAYGRESSVLQSIIAWPCKTITEARRLAEFVLSDIPDSSFHKQHASALRAIAGIDG